MQNPFDLSGQVAVITGSSKGIGRAAAEIMASLGAKVVVSSRKADACEAVAAGIKKAGGEAIVIPCNISRKEEMEGLVKGTLEQVGPDRHARVQRRGQSLLRTARRHLRRRLRQDHELQHQEQPVALQLGAARAWPRRAAAASSSCPRSAACAAAPSSAPTASPRPPTCSSTRSLAVEWGPKNVRVNCVAPGLVKTDFARALWEDPERLKRTVVDRAPAPHRRARTRSAASSPSWPRKASAFMTGTVIVADGGVTIA